MGKSYSAIDDSLAAFIAKQHIFFVASAPLDGNGRVNLSPKGLDTFRILSPTAVCYLDFNGSGVETIAHLKENGRIVLMFCAFQGPPNILRIYGRGRVMEQNHPEFQDLLDKFPPHESVRSMIVVEVDRATDSCGFGVPLLRYEGERTQIADWARKQGPEGLKAYRQRKNRLSIDGLPGLAE